ncbi:hypothetical protein MRY87_02710 [bacterium]|nr:hypothetical protein [bacterium]
MKTLLFRLVLRSCFVMGIFITTCFIRPVMAETVGEPLAQCTSLVSKCFEERREDEKANCLFSSSQHPFCKGTALGHLTHKRWIMSPVAIGGIDPEAPSFMGSKLVDSECLSDFDAYFMSSLVKTSELAALLPGLESRLLRCTKALSPELNQS